MGKNELYFPLKVIEGYAALNFLSWKGMGEEIDPNVIWSVGKAYNCRSSRKKFNKI